MGWGWGVHSSEFQGNALTLGAKWMLCFTGMIFSEMQWDLGLSGCMVSQ